ncbi:DUF2202 domain-containing protein [Cloacibacterium sp. Arc13]|uniref:DUF2202 domain-containing protein n=1 Tax=unclassified Cloacibacterium TaxID=2620870 RepID=UPI00352C8596
MKTFIKSLTIVVAFLSLTQCSRNDSDNISLNDETRNIGTIIPSINTDEKSNLLFMYEEEKMARDTYLNLYQKWQLVEFENIQKSEQSHMNAVENLLIKYKIDYPKLAVGQFQNQDLQNLYNQLILQGNNSAIEALKIGATIEDVDINDLKNLSKTTTNTLILKVYSNLMCGSRNHLRAFSSALKLQNVIYVPQFISQVDYDAIIHSPNENCGN